jgi:hypothetical protein
LPGETQRFPPGANSVGLYESTDGGNTFTEVWNGNASIKLSRNARSGPRYISPNTVRMPVRTWRRAMEIWA